MITSKEQFLESFGDIASHGFIRPVFLIDTKIGFSVQKNYPKRIKFIPAINGRGEDDSVVTIWVVYESSYELKATTRIPIRLSVDLMSRYRSKTLELDPLDPDCPTRSSQIRSEKSKQPLRLTFKRCYFYSLEKDEFVDENNTPLTGAQILEEAYNHHCESIKFVNAIRYRWQSLITEGPYKISSILINLIQFLLKHVFQRTFINRPERSVFLNGYLPDDMVKNEKYSIKILDYRISLSVALLVTILIIAIGVMVEIDEKSLLNKFIENKFIATLMLASIFFVV